MIFEGLINFQVGVKRLEFLLHLNSDNVLCLYSTILFVLLFELILNLFLGKPKATSVNSVFSLFGKIMKIRRLLELQLLWMKKKNENRYHKYLCDGRMFLVLCILWLCTYLGCTN